MNKLRALVSWFLIVLASLIAGCSGQVRYSNGRQNLQLQVEPADKAADLTE